MKRQFESKYGYFTEEGDEYVITDYRTPRPWINVISNGNYGLVVSQVNGGFSWITHSNLNRLTRWKQDLLQDNQGIFIYLRDEENGNFWSPTVQPVLNNVDSYQCRHGIGYTIISSEYQRIRSRLRVFVPLEDDMEIRTLQLTNLYTHARRIGIYTYLEWCLGAAPDNHREFHKNFFETLFNEEHNILFAKKRLWEVSSKKGHWNTDWPYIAYFASNQPVEGFESDKEIFIGSMKELGSPQAVEEGKLSNSQGKWIDAIASLKNTLYLNPGESKAIHFYLGADKEETPIFSLLKKYRRQEAIDSAFQALQKKWTRLLSVSTVDTPDEALNILTNKWLKYQAISGRLWARTAYYQQSGAIGFRDQLQDSQIFLYHQPELTKNQIILHAGHQYKDGRVLHWWHPLTEEGYDGGMSDDLLWLPFVTIQYLKETADWQMLEEKAPFYDDSQPNSLLNHCLKAIDKALERFSERGLPLILSGDWNDGLSAVGLQGKGESIWLAHFLYYLLKEFRIILNRIKLTDKVSEYERRSADLRESLNNYGWDGQWFWRASKDSGERIGSHRNEEGEIFLNPQTWAVISGSTTVERQKQAMKSVEAKLESDFGPMLLWPAYHHPDPNVGYLSRYAPGTRENGGIYTHAAIWTIWAATILQDANFAYRLYRKISPISNGLHPERYYAEPYVTPGNIEGIDSSHYGRGGWSWYTGSAAWLLRVTFDNIIGIRADYDGLIVQPCFPLDWKRLTVKRFFRGTTYNFQFENNSREKISTVELFRDGKKLPGQLVPAITDREQVNLIVRLF